METTYAKRLRDAIAHADISQAELGRRIGLGGPQAIQYLAEEKNNARGSRHTAAIARELGVDSVWLATGEGAMLGHRAKQSGAVYLTEAEQLARDIVALRPGLKAAVRQIVSALAPRNRTAARTVKLERGETQRQSGQSDKRARARRSA